MRNLLMRNLLLCFVLAFPVLAQTPAPPAPRPTTITDTQLFHVVLLRASRTGTDDTEGLPKAALKALDDLREFLPFKHYRLLDSQLVRMAQGIGGQVAMAPYQVKFTYERTGEKLAISSFMVMPATATEQPTPRAGDHESSRIAPQAIKPLISTAFQMDRGETIVVGSSRIAGDEALIVLLTAVRSK
jgi:hypothetical protein